MEIVENFQKKQKYENKNIFLLPKITTIVKVLVSIYINQIELS